MDNKHYQDADNQMRKLEETKRLKALKISKFQVKYLIIKLCKYCIN